MLHAYDLITVKLAYDRDAGWEKNPYHSKFEAACANFPALPHHRAV